MKRILLLCVGCVLFLLLVVGIFDHYQKLRPVFQVQQEERTLIIDAGHGGFDGGAQASDGTSEQYINLRVSKNLAALCGLFGEKSLLTRSDENALDFAPGRTIHENKVADIKARKSIAESVKNGVFLSIHLNKFQESQYFGSQTFYSRNHEASKLYAESIQDSLILGLDNQNTRKAKPAPETVFLMNKLECPALIVECGFLSNPQELLMLKNADYQKRLAVCILCGYLNAI